MNYEITVREESTGLTLKRLINFYNTDEDWIQRLCGDGNYGCDCVRHDWMCDNDEPIPCSEGLFSLEVRDCLGFLIYSDFEPLEVAE